MTTQVQVLVIGAGISGLATAYSLKKFGIAAITVDSGSRPGGVIQTQKKDGYLLECGPQSFSGNAQITKLCEDLNLMDERLLADSKAPRYVVINGKLQAVPMGPGIVLSPFFAGGTRTAILGDLRK